MNELHLFAGGGGGILGGMLLGHTCVCAVEIEPYCRKVLLQRQRDGILPKFPIWDDVRTFDGRPWKGKVDAVCGGFPCQDISCAGKGAGIGGKRSGLWSEFARVVGEVRPRYAFVENSPMLAVRGLGRVLGDLSALGYDAQWCVMGADDVGAPHRRKRMWILAHAGHGGGRQHYKSDAGRICDKWCCPPQKREPCAVEALGSGEGFKAMADADASLCDGSRLSEPIKEAYDFIGRFGCAWWNSDPADEDGAFESKLGRVADGVADRVDRLRAIGNGQVPLVAARAFALLMKGWDK